MTLSLTFMPTGIRPHYSNVDTGMFPHQSGQYLLDLKTEGQQEATTVTANHCYQQADRNAIVEAGYLNLGEQVQTLAGLRPVVSINPCVGNETVYNLEAQREYHYLEGYLGMLVVAKYS